MKKIIESMPMSTIKEIEEAMNGSLLKLAVLSAREKVNFTDNTKTFLEVVIKTEKGLQLHNVSFLENTNLEEIQKNGYIVVTVYTKEGRNHYNLFEV